MNGGELSVYCGLFKHMMKNVSESLPVVVDIVNLLGLSGIELIGTILEERGTLE